MQRSEAFTVIDKPQMFFVFFKLRQLDFKYFSFVWFQIQ